MDNIKTAAEIGGGGRGVWAVGQGHPTMQSLFSEMNPGNAGKL